MKRLLTYLFLVMGLTLFFQAKSYANVNIIHTAWIFNGQYFIIFLENNKCSITKRSIDQTITDINYDSNWAATCKWKKHPDRVDLEFGGYGVSDSKYYVVFSNDKFIGSSCCNKKRLSKVLNGELPPSIVGFRKKLNTEQIAKIIKKDPIQTQQVAKKVYFCGYDHSDKLPIIRQTPCKETYKRSGIYLSFSISPEQYVKKIIDHYGKRDVIIQSLYDDFEKYNLDLNIVKKIVKVEPTQIAKKEPKKKEKKKVAKVVEQEQEEIKVKVKKKDTTGPIIEIAEAITVDDSSYTLTGKVSDKGSDKIYLIVDEQGILVKRGKFKIERYSPVDEEVKIVAIDKWGNKSTKVVKVTIDIKEEMVVQKLEPLNPSRAKGKTSGEKVALIIGIENYSEAPKANYANLDAKYFFDYARKAFGAKKQNIKLLINEDATYVKTNVALTKWLRTRIKADQTDLILFFAGHGLASNDGKELYLLPQDSDPDLLSLTALSRSKLFQTIIDLKPKSVTMFLDTCYSGVSRDEQMLLASARPIRIVAGDEGEIPNNFTIFSATQLDQISSGFKEAKHGIFSYYLMKGLEGKADANKNKEITNGELLAYMDINVSQKASEQGRSQNPSLSGDPDQVLMRY